LFSPINTGETRGTEGRIEERKERRKKRTKK
jgi:hypothetical protein